jgi:hypothetical protein
MYGKKKPTEPPKTLKDGEATVTGEERTGYVCQNIRLDRREFVEFEVPAHRVVKFSRTGPKTFTVELWIPGTRGPKIIKPGGLVIPHA